MCPKAGATGNNKGAHIVSKRQHSFMAGIVVGDIGIPWPHVTRRHVRDTKKNIFLVQLRVDYCRRVANCHCSLPGRFKIDVRSSDDREIEVWAWR